ncbi:hypothetical protein KAX29_01800 [candidate division WOR-3 bacterium]|nr:hypothetical protein [candidate division WOR-3 bacterium]
MIGIYPVVASIPRGKQGSGRELELGMTRVMPISMMKELLELGSCYVSAVSRLI